MLGIETNQRRKIFGMKKVFSWFIASLLVLTALASGGAATAVVPRQRAQRAAAVKFVPRQIKEANRRLRYTITAKYPQVAIAKAPHLAKLNAAIKSLVAEQVNGFKKDFQAPEERMATAGSSLELFYTVEMATTDLVSIDFGASTYYEGAAHPNYNSHAFNYWFATGKTLELADLFKPNTNYLSALSAYSIEALKKDLGEESEMEWIQKGAGPEAENYRNWNITRKGLKISFDPYQVTYYAQGPKEVIIPYSALKGLIDPEGPLAKLR
jgi:hypothetical protein